jgi:predicted TPR repeat methyltransferase
MHDLNTLFATAVHLHQQGMLEKARAGYLEILARLPDNPSILGNLGLLCRDLGDFEAAARYCRQAVAAAPEDPLPHLNLGAVHEALGQFDMARHQYQEVLALDPHHAKALNNLGKLLHLQGESDHGLDLVRQAVAIDPSSPTALNNLGVILSGRGDTTNAISAIEKSLQLQPGNIETLYNLAGLYNCEGWYAKAADILTRLLALAPGHGPASHMLAALRGEVTPTAPADYIQETFDRYAGRFDQHLQEVLGYSVPSALAEMTSSAIPRRTFQHGLDLGCGTGLSGAAFKPLVNRLTGVDLSAQMLKQAERKGIYQTLEHDEIIAYLERHQNASDLIIAADVFIYLGGLEPFFQRLAQVADDGAVLACSTERADDTDTFTLRVSGRYAHSPDYLRTQANRAGFTVTHHSPHPIRKENERWIDGDLFLCAKA